MELSAIAGPAALLAAGKTASVGGWLGDLFDFGGATFWVLVAFVIFVALTRLCAEANKLAGMDGANFFTKAGKIFQNQQETPHERKDDRTAN